MRAAIPGAEVGKRYDPPTMPDSAPLLRVDFDTRRADTVAWLRTTKIKGS